MYLYGSLGCDQEFDFLALGRRLSSAEPQELDVAYIPHEVLLTIAHQLESLQRPVSRWLSEAP